MSTNNGSPIALIVSTFKAWNSHKAPRLAAALAYATIFALAPLFIIVIAIAGQVLGVTGGSHPHAQVEQQLVGTVGAAAGADGAKLVRDMVDASFGKPRQSAIAQIVGWVTFVLGATGLFAALQDSLNTVWDVPPGHASIRTMLRDRAVSALMLLIIGVLLLASFLANAAIALVAHSFSHILPFAGAAPLFAGVNWLVSLVVLTALFGLMYRVLPDATVRWSDVWVGGAITAVLIVVGQALIGLYLGRAGVGSAYGAAGSLLAILVWVYYSAMVLLFGAEFTRVYADSRGHAVDVRAFGTATT